jgi:hypothetical protein
MTMHEEWTDTLSAYLDNELQDSERAAVEAHLQGCAGCSAVLNDLKRVVALAQAAGSASRAPLADLWPDVARKTTDFGPRLLTRSVGRSHRRTISVTVTELAAAAVILIGVSAGISWRLHPSLSGDPAAPGQVAQAFRPAEPDGIDATPGDGVSAVPVSLADDQYDAAVADLEKALKQGRGKLDASTIAIVEHNLQTIDRAIAQAREALAADPANSYLSSHLVEARRRKLDLLRRATAFTDMD